MLLLVQCFVVEGQKTHKNNTLLIPPFLNTRTDWVSQASIKFNCQLKLYWDLNLIEACSTQSWCKKYKKSTLTRSPPVYSGVRVTESLVLCVCFVDRCLFFCTFSFDHYSVVCSSSIYGFWLALWYLQTVLITDDGQVTEAEFLFLWKDRQLGDPKQAASLFHHADTNKDNVVTQVPDLTRVFYYFDRNRKWLLITHYSITHYSLANVAYFHSLLALWTLINKIVITTKRNYIKAYIHESSEESFQTQDSKVEIQYLKFASSDFN